MTTKVSQEFLAQFPQLPDFEATWRAIYMEPMMCSGERITVAVVALDCNGCGAIRTLSPSRLLALFGEQAGGMVNMIDLVIEAALHHGEAGSLDGFEPPLSGVYLGDPRKGLGEDRDAILQQAASLTSCFYEDTTAVESTETRIDWLERQLIQVREFIERDTQRLAESPGNFSVQLSLDSWRTHFCELQEELRHV